MQPIGERVDDRHRRLARQLQAGVVGKGPNHDQVDPARQVARDVFGRFALADPDIIRGQVNRVAAKLRHAGFETDPGSQRGFLEDHGERAAAQIGMLDAGLELGLEPRRQGQEPAELALGQRTHVHKIAFGGWLRTAVPLGGPLTLRCHGTHEGTGAVRKARSTIARPRSASARERLSGGSNLSTLPAVPLTSKRSLRHASTTGRASCLSTTPMIMPSPRTSVTRSQVFAISRRRSSIAPPTRVAFSSTRSSSIASTIASPAAHDTGLPPKVVPWLPGVRLEATSLLAIIAPSGNPPPSALARVTMSGLTPVCS